MRLARILIITLLSTLPTLSYAQGNEQIQRDHETRVQAMSIFKQVVSKYQLQQVSARENSGQPASATPQTNPSLFDQIDKAVVKPKKFEGAFRASKGVLSSIEGGVSYRDYGNLIQPLLVEASILKDTAITPDEQLLAQTYADAANVYAAAGRFWSATLGTTLGNDLNISVVQRLAWPLARIVVTHANDAYLLNYRLELSPQPTEPPVPTTKKAKKSNN